MTKKTVLLLFLGDPSTDRRLKNFERFFKEQGFKTEVLAGVAESDASADEIALKRSSGPLRFLEYDRKLKKKQAAKSVDIVFACDLYSLAAAVKLKEAGKASFLIYDAREVYSELPTVAQKSIAKAYWKRQEKKGLAATDLMIVTAPHDREALQEIHGAVPKSVLIRNLPWNEAFAVPEKSLLAEFKIQYESKVFGYVGGVQDGRALQAIVGSMRGRHEHLLIVGGGSLLEVLRAQIGEMGLSDRVHLTGPVDSDRAFRLMSACDVGLSIIEPISKSYELGLPSKLFEYMAAGIPVVSSRLMHVTELFPKESWLVYTADYSEACIHEAMDEALGISEDPEAREEERKRFELEFHFEKDASVLLDALKEVPA